MFEIFNDFRGTDFLSLTIKMVLSILCGTFIGLERSTKNRPAGFRTHILVCIGSASAALAGLYIYMDLKLPSDISRISAQVISGLGFIGAGAIIVTKKHTIKGLTTAAGLLTTGIIGLTIGSGYYELGMLGTALVLITETWLGALGARIKHHPEYIVEIQYQEKDSLDRVLRCCKDNHLDIVNLKIRSQEDHPAVNYSANVHLRGGAKAEEMLEKIQMIPGITSVELM